MTKRTTPELRRLRGSPAAETIRSAVLDDQRNGRAEALAKIEAEQAADADAIDLPATFVLGAARSGPLTPIRQPRPLSPPDRRRRWPPAPAVGPASRVPKGWRWRKQARCPHRRTSPRRPTSDSVPSSPP
jgi:hypothetical protein